MAAPYDIRPINTLAFPKGKHPRCELTGVPATCLIETPHITLYYATREHAEQAWHGIMHKIAPLLGPLRANAGIVGSEEDRAKREYTLALSKRTLVDLCQQEAAKFLASGRHELAIPGATQALAFLRDLAGDGAMETVPPYLLLAEANLGLGRFQPADEFLSLANWAVLKNPTLATNAVRSQLHRNFGKLYSAQGKLAEALQELAQDVYCSAADVGPEHVNTSAGYFFMASIFYTQHRVENALAFYDKVVDIWYKCLAAARACDAAGSLGEALSESQLAEGQEMLSFILATRAKLLGPQHIATGEAKYTLGLLHLQRNHRADALECAAFASEVYAQHLGPEHPSTRDVLGLLQELNRDPAST